jgi:hypothetical protein
MKLGDRKGIFASTTIVLLLVSVAAGGIGTTYLYNSSIFSNPPEVEIINLANNELLATGVIELRGTTSHENGAIQAVSVIIDGGPPSSVVPNSINDFSEWSVSIPISSPGNHIIEVEAADNLGKTGSTKVSVVVKDARSVITTPQDQVIEATGPSGALVHYSPAVVSGSVGIQGDPDCLPASGSMFPIGTTIVTCTALFAGGNHSVSANFAVSVPDTIAPTIVAPADVTAENPGLAFMKISLGQPVVNDAVDSNPAVSNNAPANGFQLGTTTVVWTASDEYGNDATAIQKVTITPPSPESDSHSDEGTSRTYTSSGGGGGGGGGSSKSNNEQTNDDSDEENNSSSSPQYTLTINSVNLSGTRITGISATIKSGDGTTLQTGSTPLKFKGNSGYIVAVSDSDNMRFDHWENEATTEARTITLNQDVVLTAYYRSDPIRDTTPLSIEITRPAANSTTTLANNLISVEGKASDGELGIDLVEVRVDDGNYIAAIPVAKGDWTSWSVTLEITAGEHRLVPRVTDKAGNQAWNSIYVTANNPSSGGDMSGLDEFGIEKLYSAAAGGNEWYVNMADPASDPLFRNLPSMTKQSDGSWQVNGGSRGQVRMEAWSPSNEKWLNVEITGYAKMVSGSNELIQWYSRGGHHTSSNECLGSAVKARLYGDGEARWVKELTHPAYSSNRGAVQATNEPLADRWIGFKAVIYNFVENGKTYVRMESYIDDDVTNSNGNLVIDNDWQLASVVEDRGGWATNDSDFNSSCAPLNKDGTQQYRQRDEIINLPGGTSTQNIAAWRSDDLTWNWKYLSVREIVPPS